MDWEEYFANVDELLKALNERFSKDQGRINYTNGRFRLFGEKESPWLYDISFALENDKLILTTATDEVYPLPVERLDYLRLRPFYYAACIGFKSFLLYAHPNSDDEQSL